MRILTYTLIFCALLALGGCAGTQSHIAILEREGTIRTDISDDPAYDYKVFIRNNIDFGWDGGNVEDRLKTVNLMFEDTCNSVKVINQEPIKTGSTVFGHDMVTWVMKVRCLR